MIALTPEQRQELTSAVPQALDPQTGKVYVLVNEEIYEQFQDLLAPDRVPLSEQRAILHAAGLRAGWDDPVMDGCDD